MPDEAVVFSDLEVKATRGGVRSENPNRHLQGRGNLRGIEGGA